METWNTRLAKALAASDYTANKLASALGISAPSVSAWIGAASIRPARDIKADNLLKVCGLLNVRPEWVMFGRPPMRRGQVDWPFTGVDPVDVEALPERERARIVRFIRDTIEVWKDEQGSGS